MNSLIGQSFGRYHILEQLGEGGMAVVFKAFDTRLEREVAVKIIRTDAFPNDQLETVLKRFEREAKALARLSHPNIVKVLDYGEHEGAPYLVLEYLPGGTLKGHMGSALPWQEALHLLIPLARALSYAHQLGIVHRDVKPANVLMTRGGEPMLTDFGIAKILQAGDGQTLTGSGVGIGTPDYMAPEQGVGGKIDARADVYSLGVVFYELVTGRKPYIADTPMAVLLKHVTDPLPRPTSFAPELPETVENVIIKALAKAPEDRHASMEELLTAFEKLRAEATLQFARLPETAAPPQVERPTEISVSPPQPAPAEPPLSEATVPKRKTGFPRAVLWSGLGILLIGLIALAGWAASRFIPNLLSSPTPTLNLSDLPGRYAQPCGPDHRSICVANSSGEIMMSIDPPLPAGFGQLDDLAWAPDGKQIVLAAWRTATGKTENDLFIYNLETGEIQRLTGRENNVQPAWSPDGRWIAYHSSGRAMLISPDGVSQKHISAGHDDQVIATLFAWSPDSAWLAWLVREGTPIQALKGVMLYSMRDQRRTFISYVPGETEEQGYGLFWEPDGRYLYLAISPQPAQRFDLLCLETACNDLKPEEYRGDIPPVWSKHFYPQWNLEPQGGVLPPPPVAEQARGARPLKIALQAPLSGSLASAGLDIQRATELALEQLSAPLEALGFKVELVAFDDQANPEIGVGNAEKIIADEAFLCGVGHFNSATTVAASELYHNAGLPFITPTSTNPQVTDRGYLEINRVTGRDDLQGKVAAQYVHNQGFKSVFIVHDGGAYGLGLAEFFRAEAERLGLQIIEMSPMGNPSALAEVVAAKQPEVFYYGGMYDQAGPLFKQIRAAGYNGLLLGSDGLDSPDLLQLGGATLLDGAGVYYTSILVDPRIYPRAANFVRDFQAQYKAYPQPFAAPAYDAMGICLKAIENAARAKNGATPARREVAEAIRALTDYQGITNVFNFNAHGDPLISKYMLIKVFSPDPNRWSENEIIQTIELAPPMP